MIDKDNRDSDEKELAVTPSPELRKIPEATYINEADILLEELEKEQFKSFFDILHAGLMLIVIFGFAIILLICDRGTNFGPADMPSMNDFRKFTGTYTEALEGFYSLANPFEKLGAYTDYVLSFLYGFDDERQKPVFEEEQETTTEPEKTEPGITEPTTTEPTQTSPPETSETTTRPIITDDDGSIYTGYTGTTTPPETSEESSEETDETEETTEPTDEDEDETTISTGEIVEPSIITDTTIDIPTVIEPITTPPEVITEPAEEADTTAGEDMSGEGSDDTGEAE